MSAIALERVSKVYRRYGYQRRFATLKSALLTGSLVRHLRPDESFRALDDVSLTVAAGATCGIIGRNGSGKSTLLKLVAGITRPTGGQVRVAGRVSALIELGAGFHPEISGRENVFINGVMLGLSRREIGRRFDEIVEFAELEDFIDAPVKTYSSGMYMRLGFAVAVHVDPEILLVDEVLAVGDEGFSLKCLDKFAEFKRRGKTILLVTHALPMVERFCDEAVWLDGGRKRLTGDPRRVVQMYLADVAQAEDVHLAAEDAKAQRGPAVPGAPPPAPPAATEAPPAAVSPTVASPPPAAEAPSAASPAPAGEAPPATAPASTTDAPRAREAPSSPAPAAGPPPAEESPRAAERPPAASASAASRAAWPAEGAPPAAGGSPSPAASASASSPPPAADEASPDATASDAAGEQPPADMFKAREGRWGSGTVRIERVILEGRRGAAHVFRSGEPMTIRMRVVAEQPVADFAFGVSIFSSEGVCCYGTNTHIEELEPTRLDGDGEVAFVVDRLDLVAGTYKLDVAVHKRDGFSYDYHRLLYTFRVKSGTRDVGIYRPRHAWRFSGNIRFNRPR